MESDVQDGTSAVREASQLAQRAVAADGAGEVALALSLYQRAVAKLNATPPSPGADASLIRRMSQVYSDRLADLKTAAAAADARINPGSSSSRGAAGPSGNAEYAEDDWDPNLRS